MVNAIVLFSHGSLLCGSGEALEAHAARLRSRGLAPIVEVGYLNYSEPPFAEAVAKAILQGARRIVVAPYFLVPGKFVRVDLPRAINSVRSMHPEIEFEVADAIGYDERLADALILSAQTAVGPEHWRDDLQRAALSCRANPDCPLYNTPNCPQSGEGSVERLALSVENEEGSVKRLALSVKDEEEGVGHWALGVKAPTEEGGPNETLPLNAQRSTLNAPSSAPNALLIMVHGSPRPVANEEMFRVVDRVKRRNAFPIVEVGFLECNAPSIAEGIDLCVERGATKVLAVPYFLHTGTHVADDLPTLLEEAQKRHRGVEFRLGDYLGRAELLTDILADRVAGLLQR